MRYKWLVAGGLGLVLLALCGMIVAVLWASVGVFQVRGVSWRLFDLGRVVAEADEEQRLAASGAVTLDVANTAGEIHVTGGAGDEIVVQAHKSARRDSQTDAEAALEALKVVVSQDGDVVTVRVDRPEEVWFFSQGWEDTVDLTISVPVSTAVTAQTDFGVVTLSGTTGDVDLRTSNGRIEVEDVEGDIQMRSDFGSLTLERAVAEEVDARSSNGAVTLIDVQSDGDVTLGSDFGSITFETGRANGLTVQTSNGRVTLTEVTVQDKVTARSDFGSLTLEQVDADVYELRTSNGSITVRGAQGVLTARSDFGSLEVSEAEDVTVDLTTSNGAVTFSGSLGTGPHTLQSDFGRIRLVLPEDSALDVDLETDFGTVKSDLPITILGDQEPTHWRGTLNGGGESLSASTSNGDITIDILNP